MGGTILVRNGEDGVSLNWGSSGHDRLDGAPARARAISQAKSGVLPMRDRAQSALDCISSRFGIAMHPSRCGDCFCAAGRRGRILPLGPKPKAV